MQLKCRRKKTKNNPDDTQKRKFSVTLPADIIKNTVMATKDKEYVYPDDDDTLTSTFIESKRLKEFWSESENRILRRLADRLAVHAAASHSGEKRRMLDAGCGNGRLIGRFLPYFDEYVAIEPDRKRIAEAMRTAASIAEGRRVRFERCSVEAFADAEPFDFILSSHVIQHIATHEVEPMLRKLVGLLAPGGLLAVMTCHSTSAAGEERFSKSLAEGGKLRETAISKEEFDDIALRNLPDILPAHFFNAASLAGFLKSFGGDIADLQTFHTDGLDEEATNASPELQSRHGRDLYLLFRKGTESTQNARHGRA